MIDGLLVPHPESLNECAASVGKISQVHTSEQYSAQNCGTEDVLFDIVSQEMWSSCAFIFN